MAEESIPVPKAAADTAALNTAPHVSQAASAYSGWAELQQAVNVTLPGQLSQAAALRAKAQAILGG